MFRNTRPAGRSTGRLFVFLLLVLIWSHSDARAWGAPHPVPVAGAATGPETEGFMPAWQVGDRWVLEARYRNLAEGEDAWLPPVRWQFHVRSTGEIAGEDCLLLHVVPLGRPDLKVQAVLWLARRDLRPMRVVDVYPLRGKATAKRREFDQRRLTPLFPEESMIPYALPLFPFCGAPADGTRRGAAAPTVVRGEKARQAGAATFVDRVSQSWTLTPDGFLVDLDDGGPNGPIRQDWRPGSPWAVSQTGRTTEVRLVEPTPTGGRP